MPPRIAFAASLVAAFSLTAYATGPTFRPDVVFSGSSLTGWVSLGQSDWRALSGEIVGTPRQATGGWLVLERSYQDVALYSTVSCSSGCRTGVLLRAEKTADGGLKGIYVSLTEGDLASYAITLDSIGRETGRQALATGSVLDMAMGRAVGSAPPDGSSTGGAAGPPALPAWAPPPLPGNVLPGLRSLPMGEFKAGQRNAVDITLVGEAVLVRFNGGSLLSMGARTEDSMGRYGPIALYVGGTSSVSFRDLAYADSERAAV